MPTMLTGLQKTIAAQAIHGLLDENTARRARRLWTRTGGVDYSRERYRKIKSHVHAQKHDVFFPDTAVAPSPDGTYIVIPPATRKRKDSLSLASIGSSRAHLRERNRADCVSVLREALGSNLQISGASDRDWTVEVTAASASRGAEALVLDELRVAVVRNLTNEQRVKLKRQGARIIPNQSVRLPRPVGQTPGLPNTWHLQSIGVQDATGRRVACHQIDTSNVLLGIIDTGVDASHPEFSGRVKWFRAFGSNVHDPNTPKDYGDHGTHVTALAAGQTAGVLPSVDIAVAAALTGFGGTGTLRDLLLAVNWLVEVAERERRLLIINMSVATEGTNEGLRTLSPQIELGTFLVVASIGNDGAKGNRGGSPADYSTVIGVGAVDINDRVAPFSAICGSGRSKPDVYAPGVKVFSALPGATFGTKCGTSMAAPLVTGLLLAHAAQLGNLPSRQAALAWLSQHGRVVGYGSRTGPKSRATVCYP